MTIGIRAALAGLGVLVPALVGIHCVRPPPPGKIAAYGDSLTAGRDWFHGLPAEEWTPSDFGIKGARCSQVSTVLQDQVAERAAEGFVAVVIFCGTNDALDADPWDLGSVLPWIDDAARAALAEGLPVVVVAPPPVASAIVPNAATVNARLQELRAALPGLGYPVADTWAAVPDDPAYYAPDGIHPLACPSGFDEGQAIAAALEVAAP